ncbi:MAG: hypothetical protein CI949_1978 [Halanaerobium sp.]|nr:MAG: hypothetical protein CI949_1978 [Halanaerobium sp.]
MIYITLSMLEMMKTSAAALNMQLKSEQKIKSISLVMFQQFTVDILINW